MTAVQRAGVIPANYYRRESDQCAEAGDWEGAYRFGRFAELTRDRFHCDRPEDDVLDSSDAYVDATGATWCGTCGNLATGHQV
jgi:hypothetical protein